MGKSKIRARSTIALNEKLLFVIIALLVFGIVMVYSSSIAMPDAPKFSAYRRTHFLMRHVLASGIGVFLAVLVFQIPMHVWERAAPGIFLVSLGSLILVLFPFIGKNVHGARRWFPFFIFNLQPSELMKLAVILYAANYLVRKRLVMSSIRKGFLPMAVAMSLIGLLLLLEPDMGAFLVITIIAMGMLFLGNINGRLFAMLLLSTCFIFFLIIFFSPWRKERIFAYLDPWRAPYVQGKGYQLTHSLIAFGRGHWFGVGLGNSVEKLNYLPEAHTDFILAVIAEELGFIGVIVIVLTFYWLVSQAFKIGRRALVFDKDFSALVAQGIGIWIATQSFINIGVSLGLLPTKGLTLPLISYGGSGILVNCIALSLLVRIDFENKMFAAGQKIL